TTSTVTNITISNSSSFRTENVAASVSPTQFIYSGPTSFSLAPRQSRTVGVSFRPTSVRSYSSSVQFVTGSGTTISVPLSGTGGSSSTSGITLTIDPSSISLAPGAKQTFIATTHGGNNNGITWSATCGSFTTDGWYGFYTAPASGSCTITGWL